MGWDDWVFGIATGGLYNAGKAAYNGYKKVTGIVDDVSNAADQAGVAIAKIGDTVVELGDSLDSLIDHLDDMLVVERLVPRNQSDLWDEEKKRLSSLINKRNSLKGQIDTLRDEIKTETGVEVPGSYGSGLHKWIVENVINGPMSWIFGGSLSIWNDLGSSGRNKVFKIFGLNAEVIKIEKEIHEILYNEPGIIPNTVYNVKEVIERFNTIEQPKLEDIMDSIDDNLVESKEILKEVKKLFVIKKKVPINLSDLLKPQLDKLEMLEAEYNLLESNIGKDWEVAKKFLDLKVKEQPAFLEMVQKKAIFSGLTEPVKATKEDVSTASLNMSPNNLEDDLEKRGASLTKSLDLDLKTGDKVEKVNDTGLSVLNDELQYQSGIGPNVSKATKQPNILKTMSSFSDSKYYAYNNKYAFQKGIINQYERDLSKIEFQIDKIKYKEIEEPGVIPRTLANFEDILKRIHDEEQPRIEAILDSVNDNLLETKEAIGNANSILGKVSDFVNDHPKLVKIGFGVAGGAIAITLILIPILLIRLIIFGF